MKIEQRLREASAEVRDEMAAVPLPDQRPARSRWRPVVAAATAALVVVGVIGVATLLRDAPPTSDVAITEAPIPTTEAPPTTETAEVPGPESTIDLSIEEVDEAEAAAKLAAFDGFELFYSDALAVGRVGTAVLFTAVATDGNACLLWLGTEEFSSCAPSLGAISLGSGASFNTQIPSLDYELMGVAPAGTSVVRVTAGDTAYVQQPRDGFVAIVIRRSSPEPITVEVLTADGRDLLGLATLSPLAVAESLIAQVTSQAADPEVTLEKLFDLELQLRSVVDFVDANDARPGLEDKIDVAWDRLIALRAELDPGRGEPNEYPQFVPVAPEVTAAIQGSGPMSVSPDGVVWVTGGSRFGDNPSDPHFLNAIDGHTGELIARYEVGLAMHQLAAGTERVWFGRTADGAVPVTSSGYLDRRSGEVVTEDVERNLGSIILADDSGLTAFVLSQDREVAVSRLEPDGQRLPLALDFDLGDGYLTGGIAWDGGLLVVDNSGTIWRVDPSTETARVFAELGDRSVEHLGVAAAPGGGAGAWLTTFTEDEVRAVLLDNDGDIVADHLLTDNVGPFGGTRIVALSSHPVDQSAYALTMSGEVWYVTPVGEPTLLYSVSPGSPDTGFDDLERLGTSLWLQGGVAGLVQVQLGQ